MKFLIITLLLILTSCSPKIDIDKITELSEANEKLTYIIEALLDFEDNNWHITEIEGEKETFFVLAVWLEDDEYFKGVKEVLISTKKHNRGFVNLK